MGRSVNHATPLLKPLCSQLEDACSLKWSTCCPPNFKPAPWPFDWS